MSTYGPISKLVTYQGKHLKNRQVGEWYDMHDIPHEFSVEYDHHNHGLVERCNRSIIEWSRKELCQHPREELESAVAEVDNNLNFSFHVHLDRMPIEVLHGSPQELAPLQKWR